jgi:small-conductance mechanosensitive channel
MKTIMNARRSQLIQDVIFVKVDLFTDPKKLNQLKEQMLVFLKKNSKLFLPSMRMDLNDMGTSNMITLRITIEFNSNWDNPTKRWDIRSMFMFALKDALVDLDIKFLVPVQEIKIHGS